MYKGLIYGTQLAVHFMRQNPTPGGCIVATSSICGLYPMASLPEYSGAKAAASALSVRLQYIRPSNILCQIIGFVRATAPLLKLVSVIHKSVRDPGVDDA